MQQVLFISYGLVEIYNSIVRILNILGVTKSIKNFKKRVMRSSAMQCNTITTMKTSSIRTLHFCTNYNDLLVSSTKGI